MYPEINQEKCCGRGVGVPGVVKFESGVVIHVIFSVYYRTTVVAMGAKRKHVKERQVILAWVQGFKAETLHQSINRAN